MTTTGCLAEASKENNQMKSIRQRQSTFAGHVLTREILENVITEEKINGERDREDRERKSRTVLTRRHGIIKSANELIENMSVVKHYIYRECTL